jgi:hypothetical protein
MVLVITGAAKRAKSWTVGEVAARDRRRDYSKPQRHRIVQAAGSEVLAAFETGDRQITLAFVFIRLRPVSADVTSSR